MKNQLTILLLLLVGTMLFSQTKFQPTIRAGSNISEIKGIQGDKKVDFYLGGAVALNFGKFYTLQPEVTYSNQGGDNIYKKERVNVNGNFVYKETKEKYDLQYLSVSVANKLYLTPRRDFHLLLAPGFDFLIGDNSDKGYYDDGSGFRLEKSSDFTEVDLTMKFGAGYEFPFGLGVEARYKLGVVDVLDVWGSGAKNRVFQVGLTYRFFTKKCCKSKKKSCDKKKDVKDVQELEKEEKTEKVTE